MLSNAFARIPGIWSGLAETPRRKRRARRLGPWAIHSESLERRELPAAPYVLSGFSWNDPTHLTYSIAPDGVFWDHGVNNLNAVFDAKFGAGAWEVQIARALATWETVANVDFSPVPDSFKDQNALGRAQGDPRFGDIRFGGYGFANDTTTLAQTYFPPPNGSTAAGDVEINTSLNFGIGNNYDLYSVMLHELGHSLGLDHVSIPSEVMFPSYQGIRQGVSPGDVAGVQAIYGARTPDSYQAVGRGLNFGSAIDLGGMLDDAGAATLNGVSLCTPGDTEYFSVVAPPGSSGTLQVIAAGAGYSMLSPKISLYDSQGRLLDTQSNPSGWSTNAVANASGVLPGQRYFVTVGGATGDAFSVGSYGLRVAFSTRTVASPPPPPGGGGSGSSAAGSNNSFNTATRLGVISQAYLPNLTLSSGTETDYYVFRNARAGVYVVSAPGTQVRAFDAAGNLLATGVNQASVKFVRPRSTLYVQVSSSDGNAVPHYGVGITSAAPTPSAVRRRARREHVPAHQPQVVATPRQSAVPHWARPWAAGRGHS